MLHVYFENVMTRERRRIDPVARLKIAGTVLLDDRNTQVAAYQGGLWRVGDEHYFVVGLESPTLIHFESAASRSGSIGPYNPTWLVNGAIRAGESQELALARLDEQAGAWHVYADRTFWSAAVFSPSAK